MTAYRAGVRDRSGPMKSVKIPDRSGELEPAMSDFFSRSHSSLVVAFFKPCFEFWFCVSIRFD